LADELERLGLERDNCLDSIEWAMHGEGVENDARTTTLLRMNEEAERPRLGMEFKAWLIEVAGAVELNTLTAVASVCGAMRSHLVDELERVGLERDHCLDSFEWSMSGEQRVDDEKFVDALNVKSVDTLASVQSARSTDPCSKRGGCFGSQISKWSADGSVVALKTVQLETSGAL